jgi:hypothetical protein
MRGCRLPKERRREAPWAQAAPLALRPVACRSVPRAGGRRGWATVRYGRSICREDPGLRSGQHHRSGQVRVGLGRRFAPNEQPVVERRR